jgi:DNA replication protein DnaC
MLTHVTIDKLRELKLFGMVRGLEEQMQLPEIQELDFYERLGLIVDREITDRQNRRLKTRLKTAKLRQPACLEDIDYRQPRGLDKSLLVSLASCQWLTSHHNIFITGPTGVGKTYLACALAQKACREGHTVLYRRLPRLLMEIVIAKGDGSYHKIMEKLAKTDLLVIDDWGLAELTGEQKRDLLELIEDRHGLRSTLITSQLPLENWHEFIADGTLADAILDRLVHNAYKIKMKGESMRKWLANQHDSDNMET